MAATAMPDALRQYRASHAEDMLSATVEWKNRRNPLRDEDYQGIADALGADISAVSVKATTEEHLGFTGDGSGIAAHAVCLIEPL